MLINEISEPMSISATSFISWKYISTCSQNVNFTLMTGKRPKFPRSVARFPTANDSSLSRLRPCRTANKIFWASIYTRIRCAPSACSTNNIRRGCMLLQRKFRDRALYFSLLSFQAQWGVHSEVCMLRSCSLVPICGSYGYTTGRRNAYSDRGTLVAAVLSLFRHGSKAISPNNAKIFKKCLPQVLTSMDILQ